MCAKNINIKYKYQSFNIFYSQIINILVSMAKSCFELSDIHNFAML